MKKIIKHILVGLNLYPDATIEERLNSVLLEQKHRNFLDDIKRIRHAGDYVPNYNAEPKFTEYHISYNGSDIKWQPHIVVLPKEKYNTIEEWKEALRIEAKQLSALPKQLNILFSKPSL